MKSNPTPMGKICDFMLSKPDTGEGNTCNECRVAKFHLDYKLGFVKIISAVSACINNI